MVMVSLPGQDPDISSPWLIIGAAGAGVATVILTELLYRSGLVKQDAAIGLVFPALFSVAVILISRFAVPFYFGGTSLLIVVTVTMDTVTQIQSHLVAHQYEGLVKKSKLRGKRR